MQEIMDRLREADMVLIGLGEEFNDYKFLRQNPNYIAGCDKIKNAGYAWLIPAWSEFCANKDNHHEVYDVLSKLAETLNKKNYFVVSVAMNSAICRVPWKSERIVMPCGTSIQKQCTCGCEEILEVSDEDWNSLISVFEKLYSTEVLVKKDISLGKCKKCGGDLVFNNIYAEEYREEGYLPQWEKYMKWLQGTLNQKLFVLELGVGVEYPSVIRWPFEKVAFLNQKAYLCRVHESLYQLTPELTEKGCGISANAIDWLKML